MRTFRSFLSQRALVRATSLALPLAVLPVLPACDLFKKVEQAAQIPVDVMESAQVSLDVGQLTGQLAGKVTPVDLSQDLATPPIVLDLNKSQPDLAKYANGHIVTIEINKIVVTPTANTMTGDLPALEIYFGPTTAKGLADGVKVATIPPIPKGSLAPMDGVIYADAMATAGSKYLATLAFSEMLNGKLFVKAGDTVPGGKIDLKLDFHIHALVAPL